MNSALAINRLRNVLRRQHKALATEDAYVFWLRRYIKALRTMPANLPSEKKLERFLTDLARHHDLSASSHHHGLSARRSPEQQSDHRPDRRVRNLEPEALQPKGSEAGALPHPVL